jgi:hypothetical protein
MFVNFSFVVFHVLRFAGKSPNHPINHFADNIFTVFSPRSALSAAYRRAFETVDQILIHITLKLVQKTATRRRLYVLSKS